MVELSDIILKQVGLNEKKEIFWNSRKRSFETAGHASVKVEPVGQPALIVSHYDQEVEELVYTHHGKTLYTISRTHLESTLLGDNSLVASAEYFCAGEPFKEGVSCEVTPITLYVRIKK